MQASDRRISYETLDPDSERNKAIFVGERMTFAYSGRASIGGTDTAEWFQAQVARELGGGSSAEDAVVATAELVAGYLRNLTDQSRAHTFVGVGWTDEDVYARTPFILCLSNVIDENAEPLPGPDDAFHTYRRTLGTAEPCALFSAGQPLGRESWLRLNAQVAAQVEQSSEARPVALLLIDAIRTEAAENPEIGRGVMLNSLPKAPGPPTGEVVLIGGLPEADIRTFAYVPEGDYEGRYLGPLVVGSDGSVMGTMEAELPSVDVTAGRPGPGFGLSYRPSGSSPRPRAAVGQRVRTYKIDRNDPCWCGSGRKYKRCHGA